MERKIIIQSDDFNREIFSLLKEVGADMPLEWTLEAIDPVRRAVVEAFAKMGVTLEIADRIQSVPSLYSTKKEGGIGVHH